MEIGADNWLIHLLEMDKLEQEQEAAQMTGKILRADGPNGGRLLVYTDLGTSRMFGSIQEAEEALKQEDGLWVVRPARDAEGLPFLQALRVRPGMEEAARREAGKEDGK